MNRMKMKKTKVSGGQKNISSFFSSQNQKDMSSSTKVPIAGTALIKSEPQIKDSRTSIFRLHSPLKRNVLRDLENLLPSSPDLILSVPETPSSQIRLACSPLTREAGLCSPKPSRETTFSSKLGQMSPICRSPRSKGQSLRRQMAEEGGRSKREGGWSGSIKRLLSPQEEFCHAKRPRTANPSPPKTVINLTGSSIKGTKALIDPVKAPLLSSDQSGSQSERLMGHCRDTEVIINDNKNLTVSLKSGFCRSLGEKRKHQEEQDKKDSCFTVITEQKVFEATTDGNLHTGLDKDTDSLTAHVHEPSAQTLTPAPKDGEGDLNVTETMRTPVTDGNGDKATGENTGTTSACPTEETLDECWFAEHMEHNEDRATEDKPKKPQ